MAGLGISWRDRNLEEKMKVVAREGIEPPTLRI